LKLRFCTTYTNWYKINNFEGYFDYDEKDKNFVKDFKEYMTTFKEYKNRPNISENLAKLLIENIIENRWPKGLRTKELREKNKDVIKQMKGE